MPNLDFEERHRERRSESRAQDKSLEKNHSIKKEDMKERAPEVAERAPEVSISLVNSPVTNDLREFSEKTFEHGACQTVKNEKALCRETKPWIKSLDIKEKLAVLLYTGSLFYRKLNKCLRENLPMSKTQNFIDRNLNEALDKSRLPQNMILYRRARSIELGTYCNCSPEELLGKDVTLQAYSSTSIKPARKVPGENRDLFWQIDAPKGTHAAYLKDISLHRREKEVLLPKGTVLKIIGVDERISKGNKIRIIHAEIKKEDKE